MFMHAYKKYLLTLGVVWAVSLAVFVAVFLLLVSPQLKALAALDAELSEKKRLADSAVEAAKDENRKKLLGEVAAMKLRLGDYAVESEESANLTFDVSRIAGDKQVGAVTVKTPDAGKSNDQTEIKNLQENHIDVTFESDYRQFAMLLNALERHRPVLFIDRLKLTRGDVDARNHKVEMGLTFFAKKRPEG